MDSGIRRIGAGIAFLGQVGTLCKLAPRCFHSRDGIRVAGAQPHRLLEGLHRFAKPFEGLQDAAQVVMSIGIRRRKLDFALATVHG